MTDNPTALMPCECTRIEQDETCPVGYPSLLCDICDGKGVLQPVAWAYSYDDETKTTKQAARLGTVVPVHHNGYATHSPIALYSAAALTTLSAKLAEAERVGSLWKAQAQQGSSVIAMIRAMIGEMFGPVASIESEEATLLRGPEAKHDGEAVLAALQRIEARLSDMTGERDRMREVESVARRMPRTTPAPGSCSTEHLYSLSAGLVWDNDRALSELDAARAALTKETGQ